MVNTFLIGSYEYTAISLDLPRLMKQAVEAKQVIMTIEDKIANPNTKRGFRNHPIVIMWQPYLDSLKLYYNTILRRLLLIPKFHIKRLSLYPLENEENIQMPWFLSYLPLIYSHRARLYQKNPKFYSFLDFPDEYLDIGYIWVGRYEKEYYLQEINQYSYDDLLSIADPLDKRYIQPRYCPAIKNNGETCNHMIKTNKKTEIYCGIHKKKFSN
jgi:hypothetical protein